MRLQDVYRAKVPNIFSHSVFFSCPTARECCGIYHVGINVRREFYVNGRNISLFYAYIFQRLVIKFQLVQERRVKLSSPFVRVCWHCLSFTSLRVIASSLFDSTRVSISIEFMHRRLWRVKIWGTIMVMVKESSQVRHSLDHVIHIFHKTIWETLPLVSTAKMRINLW